jgi:hypothetical protein
MMKCTLCVLAVLLALVVADPTYWLSTIPNGAPGSPTESEFRSLVNIPGTSLNVLYGGVAYVQL